MKEYRIAVVAGDGIGPEVMAECKKVLTAAADLDGGFRFVFTDFPWGCQYYLKTGQMMPEDGIETLRGYDAILLGAVGYPGVPDNISLRDLLIRIRHDFDQYINLRPVKLLKGADCPLKDVKIEDVNMTFIRENTEGEYSGQGAWLYKGQPGEVVIQDSVFSRKGTERVIRYAYELAKKEHKTLTSISKANAGIRFSAKSDRNIPRLRRIPFWWMLHPCLWSKILPVSRSWSLPISSAIF